MLLNTIGLGVFLLVNNINLIHQKNWCLSFNFTWEISNSKTYKASILSQHRLIHNLDTSLVLSPGMTRCSRLLQPTQCWGDQIMAHQTPVCIQVAFCCPHCFPLCNKSHLDAFFCCFHIVTDGSSPGDTSYAQALAYTRSRSPVSDNPPLASCTLPSFALEPPSSSPPKAPSAPVGSTALWPLKL